jgi:type IV secretion system protein VirB8
VQVNAVTFLSPASGRRDLAQVRFMTTRAIGSPGTEQVTQYVATLQYTYGTPSTDDRLRSANPLGFKVLEYRKEPEVQRVVVPATASGASTVASRSEALP